MLALFPGMDHEAPEGRHPVGGEFHDEHRRFAPEKGLFEDNPHHDSQHYAQNVQGPEHHPCMCGKEGPYEDDIDGQPCAAGHQGDEQGRQCLVSRIFQGPCCVNCGNIAPEAEQHGDERLAVQADGMHNPVHYEGGPRHVTASFQKGDEEHPRKYHQDKNENVADPGYNPVGDEGTRPGRRMNKSDQGFGPMFEGTLFHLADPVGIGLREIKSELEHYPHGGEKDRDAEDPVKDHPVDFLRQLHFPQLRLRRNILSAI